MPRFNQKIQAALVVMKKAEAESKGLGDFLSGFFDGGAFEFFGKITLRLVSADKIAADPKNKLGGGKIGAPVSLQNWSVRPIHGEIQFHVEFDWNEDFGTPGAILVHNGHHDEFYLKTVTLDNVPHQGSIHFTCNSWVYSTKNQPDRVFFANKPYLPHETPEGLRKYREEELMILRGKGKEGQELKDGDRVYDYALYNDLGNPDKSPKLQRPVLGGSSQFPYPRRGRTSRPATKSDAKTESRAGVDNEIFKVYVPRDEHFSRGKTFEFNNSYIKAFLTHRILPVSSDFIDSILQGSDRDEFESFKELNCLYPPYPLPQVIKDNRTEWRTDEEFAREMLAGVNPLVIRLLKEFPPTSKLDPYLYGNQNSSITEQHIRCNLEGLNVEAALRNNRLFILDHHDTVIPYLRKINSDTVTKTYASRTILFLKDDGTLKPLAIELSLPDPQGDRFGVVNGVHTPAEDGTKATLWQFAKAYVAVNDCGHHQLISHWLNTHAVIEPFIIATNRQLSAVHPIYKLLHPHFRDTMTINALAREVLVNGGGLVEETFYPGKYSLEMSSVIYKSWNFLDQALPNDLKKRGMAVDDFRSPYGLCLLIEDYPFAVDGLKIWFAIKKWVTDYCLFYYKTDEMVRGDPELQTWWNELREVGHGDKKDEAWWPRMQTREELIESCTIIIWIASALHASVNFGQYAYGGFPPNRPTLSRRLLPDEGTPEYAELQTNPEKAFFKTITSLNQSLTGISLIETLSKHLQDEVYLGQRPLNWTADQTPNDAFEEFQKRLQEIEKEIIKMNKDERYKNRAGPVNVPYTLLQPEGEVGLSGKGIPNSISI